MKSARNIAIETKEDYYRPEWAYDAFNNNNNNKKKNKNNNNNGNNNNK